VHLRTGAAGMVSLNSSKDKPPGEAGRPRGGQDTAIERTAFVESRYAVELRLIEIYSRERACMCMHGGGVGS
jgi:hypothetical protein